MFSNLLIVVNLSLKEFCKCTTDDLHGPYWYGYQRSWVNSKDMIQASGFSKNRIAHVSWYIGKTLKIKDDSLRDRSLSWTLWQIANHLYISLAFLGMLMNFFDIICTSFKDISYLITTSNSGLQLGRT